MNRFNFNYDANEEMYEEECAMDKDYGYGNYMKKACKHSVLTRDEETALAKRIARGDLDARDELVEANDNLVYYLAKGYKVREAEYEDFIQEGRIGLMNAADKFDYTMGTKFSTYAGYYIKERFSNYIRENGRAIRIPSNMIDKITKQNHAEEDLEEILGRMPTEKETAKKLGVSVDAVHEIRRIRQNTASLDMPVGEDGEDTLKDTYKDEEADTLEDIVMKNRYKEDVANALANLTEYERKVLTMRYGIESDEEMTLDAVAKEFNLNREGIRKIEARALRKVKNQLGNDYMAA